MITVLFVCMGNICRSPAGEGILRSLAAEKKIPLTIASCGLGDWHVGQPPDERMQKAAAARGLVLNSKAQQFSPSFYDRFDYVLAADQEVVEGLHRQARHAEDLKKIYLMTAFSKQWHMRDVPDPYFGHENGFDEVLDLLEEACKGILSHIELKHLGKNND